jgi:hypothetical protein
MENEQNIKKILSGPGSAIGCIVASSPLGTGFESRQGRELFLRHSINRWRNRWRGRWFEIPRWLIHRQEQEKSTVLTCLQRLGWGEKTKRESINVNLARFVLQCTVALQLSTYLPLPEKYARRSVNPTWVANKVPLIGALISTLWKIQSCQNNIIHGQLEKIPH